MISAAQRSSVHRRVVLMSLLVSAMAVLVVLAGITAFDVHQYRARAREDAGSLAGILSQSSVGALAFHDSAAARVTLANLRLQTSVPRACIYDVRGGLFAGYTRDMGGACPEVLPVEPPARRVGVTRAVRRNQDILGYTYVEGDLSGLGELIGLLTAAGFVLLIVAGVLAYLLAQRLTRGVSQPISRLAEEARRIGRGGDYTLPEIPAGNDEVGDLVRSFQAMVMRVREAKEGLVREIEQRKAIEVEREVLLEREREESRRKDEFVATVSHELRTPLGAILGWTQVMRAAELDRATQNKAIEAITRSAEAQARVIEDLVDVSRIAAGKLTLAIEVVDLRIPVGAALDLARREAQASGLTLESQLPTEPALARADRGRIQQVVTNLLSNAVKFTERGGRVTLILRSTGANWEIAVSDDGVGIDPSVIPHIFDRYRQGDSSTTRRFEGLGLGLAIVKEVTEMHGGSVSAYSEGPGTGATFRVWLPRPTASVMPVLAHQDGRPEERLDGVVVLAVDDNADALDIMATALASVGAEVRTASSGLAAIREWDRDPPDVLLCDLAMPGMDGFHVLAEVKERDAVMARHTPAIAVTAHATPEHRRRSAAAGFSAHVTKPYRVPELVRAVRAALE